MLKRDIIFDENMNMTVNVPFIDTIANILRDSKDKEEGYLPEEYKNVIIPMLVITRLDLEICDEETQKKIQKRLAIIEQQNDMDEKKKHDMLLSATPGKKFYNTSGITLEKLKAESKDTLAKTFKDYLNGYSPEVKTLIKSFKFYDEIDKMKKCRVLSTVINQFWNNRDLFDPKKTDDTAMGDMFEMVIRKYFATSSNGQFFTPREIIALMMNILLNSPDVDDNKFAAGASLNILDMACGTGGMLSVAQNTIKKVNPDTKLTVNLFGQENDPKIHAVCVSDVLVKGQDAKNIKCSNTLYEDSFPNDKMDFILANPPFGTDWKPSGSKKDEKSDNLKQQYSKIKDELKKRENGKYEAGIPSNGQDCQLMFIQHALYKLKDDGKACIISNSKPLFSGDVGDGESDIRKWILDKDYLEAIIKLPGQMFFNTGINIYINVFSKKKIKEREKKVILIDASDNDGNFNFHRVAKHSAGNKRNEITKEHVQKIVELYYNFKPSKYSKIISTEDFMLMKFTTKQAYQCDFAVDEDRLENLREGKLYNYLSHGGRLTEEYIELLLRADTDELENDEKEYIRKHNIGIKIFERIFAALRESYTDEIFYNIEDFTKYLQRALGMEKLQVPTGKLLKNGKPSMKTVVALTKCENITTDEIKKGFWGSKSINDLFNMLAFDLGVHDEKAEIIVDSTGIIYDDDTKTSETIEVTEAESKIVTEELEQELSESEKKELYDDNRLYGNRWTQRMTQKYMEKEVLPYAPNTFRVDDVIYGADWSFNKQFYIYKPLPKSSQLLLEFKTLENEIAVDLEELLSEVE